MCTLVVTVCIIICLNIQHICTQSVSPPVWSGNTIDPSGYEEGNSTPIGSLLGTITAKNRNNVDVILKPVGEETEKRIHLTYNVTAHDATGYIYLKKELDREQWSSWELFFKAYDSLIGIDQVAAYRVTISILDVNDNPPRFKEPFYQAVVKEDTNIPTSVLTVAATDPDNGGGGSFDFHLQPAGQSANLTQGYFSIDPQTGIVRLQKKLEFDQISFFQYDLIATDKDTNYPLTGSASLVIKVEDIQNLPPFFDGLPYMTNLNENAPNGTKLNLNITAKDRDLGIPNSIEYYIVDDTNCIDLFQIDKKTGNMTTKIVLDRDGSPIADVNGVCRIVIQAQETNSSGLQQHGSYRTNTTVVITVNDLNDNLPKCNFSEYTGFVRENTSGASITFEDPIRVSDEDKDDKANTFNILLKYLDGSNVSSTDVYTDPQQVSGNGRIHIRLGDKYKYDYETNKTVKYKLVAIDKWNNSRTGECLINVTIIDTNDNSPVFQQKKYNVDIPEHNGRENSTLILPMSVINITATDEDSGEYGDIRYSLLGEDENFEINNITGELLTKKGSTLDRETRHIYILIIEAVDGGGLRDTTLVNITLNDVNDNYPQFLSGITRFTVIEGKNTTESKIEIKAIDADKKSTLNSTVRYTLEAPYLVEHFNINTTTGKITLNSPIDYENEHVDHGEIILNVTACDQGIPSLCNSMNITIIVQDINDNEPNFTEPTFIFNLTENKLYPTSVGNVSATDEDGTTQNREISYYIETGGMDKFRMNGKTGEIIVDRGAKIDRETVQAYNLTILAIDRGTPALTGTASVIISVLDVNDVKPQFNDSSCKVEMMENTTSATTIAQCAAFDVDLNSNLSFSIYNTSATYSRWAKNETAKDIFNITDDGSVRLLSKVDREIFSQIQLTLKVADLNNETADQTATATLTINILDVNDNTPYFLPANISIKEGISSGPIITLSAKDRDQETKFNFTIDGEENPFGEFELENTLLEPAEYRGSVQLFRKGQTSIDRERNETLDLKMCVDDGVNGNCTLFIITVDDVNDNIPTFNPDTQDVNLTENLAGEFYRNKLIHNLSATDMDIGANSNMTYRISKIEPENLLIDFYLEDWSFNDEKSFVLCHSHCGIFVNGSIDREKTPKFTLTIEAKDNPLPPEIPLTGTATVVIDIQDLNDSPPTFVNSPYYTSILEDATIGQSIIKLTAVDPDASGNNEFFFNFTEPQPLFNLDRHGYMSVKSILSGKFGYHNVTVEVVDTNNETLKSLTNVSIFVEDKNDNAPQCHERMLRASIYECARNDTLVTQVNATDADAEGPNSLIEYSFSDVNTDAVLRTFQIKNNTGEIRTINTFNVANYTYKVYVEIADHGVPRLSSSCQIDIYVIDVNDNPPKFDQDSLPVKVKENIGDNKVIATVTATDKDSVSEIRYSIIAVEREDLRDFFNISDKSGEIRIIKPLDRENANQTNARIEVKATDMTARNISGDCDNQSAQFSNSTTINVTITVTDVNDNPPVFKNKNSGKGIRRNTKLGTLIEDLKNSVTDPDEGVNKIHRFEVVRDLEYKDKNLEKLIKETNTGKIEECPDNQKDEPICLTLNGSLYTNILFEETMKGYINIFINASDEIGYDTVTFRLDIISDDQTLAMLIYEGKSYVQQYQEAILRTMGDFLNLEFVSNGIESYVQNGIQDMLRTYLYFHVVNHVTTDILNAVHAKTIIDKNADKLIALRNMYRISAITEYKDTLQQDEDEGIKTIYIMVGIIVLLGVTVLTVGFCFCHSVTRYQRKLRAATTKTTVGKSLSGPYSGHGQFIVEDRIVDGRVEDVDLKESHPGTNLYARSTNPLLDKEAELNNVDYTHYDQDDNKSVASYDSMQFEKKTPVGGEEEKGAVMDMYDETVAIQGDADALAMVLEQHRRERRESNMGNLPPPYDDDDPVNPETFKHAFDNETFDLNLETTEV